MQLLAAIANDADHMPSLLYALRAPLSTPAPEAGDVWGLGYFAQDRALIIRKPGSLLSERSFLELGPEAHSRVLLASVEDGTVPLHQAPPHRFRGWLFASVGSLAGLEPLRSRIEDKLPGFIRSELGGASASELVFAMFVRELHERALFGDGLSQGPLHAEALARTGATLGALCAEAGVEVPAVSFAATNGRTVIVSRPGGGPPVSWRHVRGLEALPDGPPDPARTDFLQVVTGLKRFRAAVFASRVEGEGWTELAEGGTVWIDRQLELRTVGG
jgi:predicted glutamine amidotransferase